ncbi:MAG: hypothetical protein PHY72_00065 [Candidatus Pacebacteria bacterium]|nr:hypothetical protein [Candidatus Paceibacterota bacterium]
MPEEKEQKITLEQKGNFDAEYRAISRFILQGKKYLKKNGALYLGFGFEGGDEDILEK